MTHYMKLNPEPFEKIASGKKTIELRLYDEKRKQIKPDDEIIFTHIQNPCRSISVIVNSVMVAASFESLFKHISLIDCGYEESEINGANHLDMNRYYSEEKQTQYGAVGIKFSKNTKRSLADVHVPYEEVEAFLTKRVVMNAKQIPVVEWFAWFKSSKREASFPKSYKAALEANTLETTINYLDEVITSCIYNQSIELQDQFCEEIGYDGFEDVREFLRRYYDRPISLDEYFPLKAWWEATRIDIIHFFCGTSAIRTECYYSTVFDGVDEDGDWYRVL